MIVDLDVDKPIIGQIKALSVVWVYCPQIPACRFLARIRRVFTDPPLLVLDWPPHQSIEALESSTDERATVFIRVTGFVGQIPKKLPWQGYILMITESGCKVLGDLTSFIDRDLFLSFRIPWTGEEIRAIAKAEDCEITNRGIQTSLKFVELDPQNQQRLQSLIRAIEDDQLSQIITKSEKGRVLLSKGAGSG